MKCQPFLPSPIFLKNGTSFAHQSLHSAYLYFCHMAGGTRSVKGPSHFASDVAFDRNKTHLPRGPACSKSETLHCTIVDKSWCTHMQRLEGKGTCFGSRGEKRLTSQNSLKRSPNGLCVSKSVKYGGVCQSMLHRSVPVYPQVVLEWGAQRWLQLKARCIKTSLKRHQCST